MRPITERFRGGEWSGSRAFIVGSGPSLKGFDYSLLDGEKWIACNEAYLHGKPTIALCQDPRIFRDVLPERVPYAQDPRWFGGPHVPVYFKAHPDRPDYAAPDSVFQANSAHTLEHQFRWGESLEMGLYYGANVGMSAINLAEILGADPIYLLGFDAKPDDERTHEHDNYPPDWKLENPDERGVVYRRWHIEFRKIAQMVRARVINLNPSSGIDAFEKWNYARAERPGGFRIYPYKPIDVLNGERAL